MTPDKPKCEHESIQTIRFGKEPLEHYCAHCRVRMVPSDVLEEALNGLKTARLFVVHAFGVTPESNPEISPVAQIVRILDVHIARIDGVLGK